MDPYFRPTRVEISLDALASNIGQFRKEIPAHVRIMAVVKANAYGHGAVETAKEAIRSGVNYLGVAILDEAIELRLAGITVPILVMGYTPPGGVAVAAKYRIALTVYTEEVLERIAELEGLTTPFKIHIKYDTGMSRIGLSQEDEAVAFIEKARAIDHVEVEGLFTHFASADERDKQFTRDQHARMLSLVRQCEDRGIRFSYIHAGNSATAIDVPELSFNMVRVGISMYGFYPSGEVNRQRIKLTPVMTFKTEVVMVKQLPPDTGISYNRIYHTREEEQIITLPVGYADGYSRMLTGKADVLVRGQRRPVVGRICMDQCMVRANGLGPLQIGEEVVLFGRQGEETITADELAEKLGTIHYEIVCMIASRVPKVYVKGGQVVEVVNSLLHDRVPEKSGI